MIDILDEMSHMLYEPGETCELGWFEHVDSGLTQMIIEITDKPCCFVKDWTIWDLDFDDVQLEVINEWGNTPVIIYARHVIEDQQQRYIHGDQMRSSLLKALYEPAFFETNNTMYVLVGLGTRKLVAPELAARLFFGS